MGLNLIVLIFTVMASGAVSSTSMKGFLQRAVRAVSGPGSAEITICIGNEAADADSIISSLCYAYTKQRQQQSADRTFVPIVSVPRNILKLRRETELLLEMVDLDLDDLICLDEVDVAEISKEARLKSIVLLDHNLLGKCVTNLLPGGETEATHLVEQILDHHEDAGAYPSVEGSNRQVAFDSATKKAVAGSTCTLVAEQHMEYVNGVQAKNGIFDEEEALQMQNLSILLQGVITIDTQNMSEFGVGTSRDENALNLLKPLIDEKVDRNQCFEILRDAKTDPAFWDSLSQLECLAIDYKQFPQKDNIGVGISSVLLPIKDFLQKESSIENLQTFMMEKDLDSLLVMSAVLKPEFRRELFILAKTDSRIKDMEEFLTEKQEAVTVESLPLDGFAFTLPSVARAYVQHSIKASRKQVAPLVSTYYSNSIL